MDRHHGNELAVSPSSEDVLVSIATIPGDNKVTHYLARTNYSVNLGLADNFLCEKLSSSSFAGCGQTDKSNEVGQVKDILMTFPAIGVELSYAFTSPRLYERMLR